MDSTGLSGHSLIAALNLFTSHLPTEPHTRTEPFMRFGVNRWAGWLFAAEFEAWVSKDVLMSNVVNLNSDRLIWVCQCGCSSFSLVETGDMECTNCCEVASGAGQGWYDRSKEMPRKLAEGTPHQNVESNGSEEFAKARIARLASDADVIMHIVVKEDSRVHLWTASETPEQIEWANRRLDDVRELLNKGK